MFNVQQLGILLKMQNDMQCAQLGDTWVEATDHKYGRAIAVEACEAMEHVGFKWWKDKEPDMDQLIMELVDILHFELCSVLQAGATHTDRSATMYMANEMCEEFKDIPEESFTKKGILHFLDSIAVHGILGHSVMYTLMTAFKLCGLTGDDVFKLYIGKNVLNTFRRANGYKEGSYIKIWNGREDNEVLTEILANTEAARPDFVEALTKQLDYAYDKVKELSSQE
jgi:dimeric dUTPase (all-alpha-NTP-PPase superfamily)